MSYCTQERTCSLIVPSEIAKLDLVEWINEFSSLILNRYVSSGSGPEHFESNDLEIPEDADEATALIANEIWRYVRWCESNRAEDALILIHCEDDTDASDHDWFLEITHFIAKKTSSFLPGIRLITQGGSKSTIEEFVLLQKEERIILKSQQDIIQILSAHQDRLDALL
jgi:hypothetical protein